MWESVLRPSTCGNVIRTPKVLKRLERLLPKPVIGAANQHLGLNPKPETLMHEASSFMATGSLPSLRSEVLSYVSSRD